MSTHRPTVLLADDHPQTAAALRTLLEGPFDVVDCVADGEALVRAATRLSPDVIVSDIGMPRMDGIDAARHILAMNPDARVVLVTVQSDASVVERSLAEGVLGYVVKMVAGDELVPAVQAALRGQRHVSGIVGFREDGADWRGGAGGECKARRRLDQMSSMPWSIGPSTHPVSRFPPRGPLVASDRVGHGAAVDDGAERTGGAEALGRAQQEIAELKARLAIEQIHCRAALEHGADFEDMVGRTPAMLRLHDQIAQVSVTDSTVLVTGETGTGKELVAHAVHSRSRRRNGPLVTVNCGALSPTLVESELFGHERGAFTGATSTRIGRFELADRGTLFLDEVGELPEEMQVKLLRVLQTGEVERLGSTRTRRVDVRLIAATNRVLTDAVAQGRFRSDLYYRLHVFPIEVPPLRERREDIPLLVAYLAERKGKVVGKTIDCIPDAVMRRLMQYLLAGQRARARERHRTRDHLVPRWDAVARLGVRSRPGRRAPRADQRGGRKHRGRPSDPARRRARLHRQGLRRLRLANQGPGLGIRATGYEAEHALLPHEQARHRSHGHDAMSGKPRPRVRILTSAGSRCRLQPREAIRQCVLSRNYQHRRESEPWHGRGYTGVNRFADSGNLRPDTVHEGAHQS